MTRKQSKHQLFIVSVLLATAIGVCLWTRRSRSMIQTQLEESVCDVNCRSFRETVFSPEWKLQKAAIYVLTTFQRFEIKRMLRRLEAHFPYPYPLIFFYEGVNLTNDRIRELQNLTSRPIFFQRVTFRLPNNTVAPAQTKNCPMHPPYNSLGHMCRFLARAVYDEPILKGLDYYWRLDDDSYVASDITHDIFQTMHDRNALYGFTFILLNDPNCIIGLENTTLEFIRKLNTNSTFFQHFAFRNMSMFDNNFEVSAASVWRSRLYESYMDLIDAKQGIYQLRWGDSPIKSFFVSIAVPPRQVLWFNDFVYIHKTFNLYNSSAHLKSFVRQCSFSVMSDSL